MLTKYHWFGYKHKVANDCDVAAVHFQPLDLDTFNCDPEQPVAFRSCPIHKLSLYFSIIPDEVRYRILVIKQHHGDQEIHQTAQTFCKP